MVVFIIPIVAESLVVVALGLVSSNNSVEECVDAVVDAVAVAAVEVEYQ